jgi:hypothetical protein
MVALFPPDNRSPAPNVVHLADDLAVCACAVADGFWADRARAELATGRLLSVFTYEVTWDYQERHPTGDELVLVLDGDVELLLDLGEGERAQHLARGGAGIVPAGSWHRVAVVNRATLLFVTPVPALTEHRACASG